MGNGGVQDGKISIVRFGRTLKQKEMSYNPFSLEGKTILVTGASSGIGQATAIECSKMGAKLVLTARDEGRLKQTLEQLDSGGHRYILADLVEGGELERLVEEVGLLDGVVLSAGKGLTLPFPFCTKEKYDEIFNVNFFSQIELLRLLYKKKKLLKGASAVIVVSIGGTDVFSVGNAIYGASKAALDATMKFCANEFAARGIRVNSVNPGMVNTKLIHRGTLTEEQFKADMERYPLKRYGEPEDVARGIVYLLSDAASWVTGTELKIDGGRTLR